MGYTRLHTSPFQFHSSHTHHTDIMGFLDFASDAGMALLDNWVKTRSYIVGYSPSQADVKSFQAIKTAPKPENYPHAYRWYKHIQSFEPEFSSLPGDPTKEYTAYGPESHELPTNPAKAPNAAADDDEVDLFGSDDEEEDQEAKRVKEERLKQYAEKKAAKGPKPAAKSMVSLDVKPWDDETDMQALEEAVRCIETDGFGIKKLMINLVVEDEKVSLDELQEEIDGFEDYVQSSDIAAMQKI